MSLPTDDRAAVVDLARRYFETAADQVASASDALEDPHGIASAERHLSIASHLASAGLCWLEEAGDVP
jgi:hypothetical protein